MVEKLEVSENVSLSSLISTIDSTDHPNNRLQQSKLYNRFVPTKMSMILLLLLLSETISVNAFTSHSSPNPSRQASKYTIQAITTSVDELEKDLTPSERSVTAVVRQASPSVTFVTSVWPQMTTTSSNTRRRGQGNNDKTSNNLPPGQSLGSGSGFAVSPDGYICTNFHVIERAYTLQKNAAMLESMIDELVGNLTSATPLMFSSDFLNFTQTFVESQLLPPLPQVYVRINSRTKYQKCSIVDVNTDLDLAVLKLLPDASSTDDNETDDLPSIKFGSSSDLLVGQTVVAIGNPFGLDTTVTTGVVSANNREFRAGTARTPANTPIQNVIQTDASINPGNSGGPLLNLKGEVVGINTAIITTSGSSAGIGFAVPSDQLAGKVQDIIRKDRLSSAATNKEQGWLGVTVVRQPITNFNTDKDASGNTTLTQMQPLARLQNWILQVEPNSPAAKAGMQPLRFQPQLGSIQFCDAIVAVGGNTVETFDDLSNELASRVVGEQVAITMENVSGDRRVVYVTLGRRP